MFAKSHLMKLVSFGFTRLIVLFCEFIVYRNVKSHISHHAFKSSLWCLNVNSFFNENTKCVWLNTTTCVLLNVAYYF